MANKNGDEDFIRDRLVPFFIGLAVTVGLSVLYAVLYGASLALLAAGGFSAAISGSPFGVLTGMLTGMLIGVPLWLLMLALSLAFWVLTTWLLGLWTREKYRNYKRGRMEKQTEHKSDAYDAWFAEKRRQEAEEKRLKQEAEWEKEWILMKKRERENSSSEKPKKKAKPDSELPQTEGYSAVKEEQQ